MGIPKQTLINLPEMMQIGLTRVIIGAGLALLLGDRMTPEQRRSTGMALLTVGTMISIPLVFEIFDKQTTEFESSHTGKIAA